MVSRQTLYGALCVASSVKEVIKGSTSVARESAGLWLKTSSLTRPLLSKYQWFYDPEWEKAKSLSERLRNQKFITRSPGRPKNVASKATRSFSTSARRLSKDGQNFEEKKDQIKELQSSDVPSSRISRLFHYGSLAAGVGLSAASQGLNQVISGKKPTFKSLILSEENLERITKKFSKMRGAALKIGQLMSFQDEKVLPRELYEIISRVQNRAHYMPRRQLDRVLTRELGPAWAEKLGSFDPVPIAAASIGQVHEATLKSGEEVVMKIQYPGVKESIDSDLNNILMFLTASRLLPRGLYLDKTVANARVELKWECDYEREASCLEKFEQLLSKDPILKTPHVIKDLTTENIITMTRMHGTEIMKLADTAPQETRDFISSNIMKLCLQEIAEFKFMQTDPNWANFFYNAKQHTLELLDFGASRSYSDDFIFKYRRMLTLGTKRDREGVAKVSKELGYLTGFESKAMVDAHVDSVLVLSEPFSGPIDRLFDFSHQTVTDRIRENIGLMLEERLCPPPEETYSLHRKFSGVFLLCAKMQAKVPMAELFQKHFALHD
ncbi:LAMI_0F08592g1_1 [Lachancea mirantina]|uniref:LAMI_0F08592g1_1 n=1 Tax=Lachancea mirantina TaxID=1230905 RepID=A0A1G4K0J2_9SACH|nr:LAMI_0F08592g1_1 [Lachancea mirantina]